MLDRIDAVIDLLHKPLPSGDMLIDWSTLEDLRNDSLSLHAFFERSGTKEGWRTDAPPKPLDEVMGEDYFVTIMSWRGEPYVCEATWMGEHWFIESRGFLDMGAGEHEPKDILAWRPMLEPYNPTTTRPRAQWRGAVIVDVEYLCANGKHEKPHFLADSRDPDHLFEEIVQAKEALGAEWVWCP